MIGTACPRRDELADFCSAELSAERFDKIANHLERCPACEAVVNDIESAGVALVAPLREPPTDSDFLTEPEFEHVCKRVEGSLESTSGIETCGPTLQTGPPPRLRDYDLIGVVGQGGMGTVYKARHSRLNKLVAVKLLPEDRVRDPQSVARFEREMKAVGTLHHPNIVAAHDAGEADGRHFLAMEYVEGLNLSELVRRLGPLSVADACELIRQAAVALDYAHQQALVHRDIKPSNLMLTSAGQVKILDLGLARLYGETAAAGELTDASQIMGTSDYMAPEQADDSHSVDGRADIYGLGCTLYKLLSGEAPFTGKQYRSRTQKLLAHLQTPPPPLVARSGDLPAELSAVVGRMLAKSPAARYESAAALATVLAPFAADSNLCVVYAAATAAESRDPAACDNDARLLVRRNDTPGLTGETTAGTSSAVKARRTPPLSAISTLASPPVSRPPARRLIVAAAGAAAVALGVTIIIKMRDGSSTTVTADGDIEQITVRPIDNADTKTANADAKTSNLDRSVAEWVLAIGGRVGVVSMGEVRSVDAAADLPPKAFRISSVDVRDVEKLSDDDLARLHGLTEIQLLNLWGTNIDDAGLAHIAGLKSLRHLILRSTRVTEAGFQTIAGLTNLEGLSIEYTAFTDDGLGKLTSLTRLKYLQAPTTLAVGDAGLLHLRRLTRLEHVSINAMDATPIGLAFVEDLPKLEVLDLLTTPVDDAGLNVLAQAKRLKWLRFTDAGITVNGWRELLALSRLRGLHVLGRDLGDVSLHGLVQLTHLDDLMISGFAAGDEGLKQLAQMKNLKLLHLEPCEKITDDGLAHLETMPKLNELILKDSRVTAAGVERLQKALPDCKITQ